MKVRSIHSSIFTRTKTFENDVGMLLKAQKQAACVDAASLVYKAL